MVRAGATPTHSSAALSVLAPETRTAHPRYLGRGIAEGRLDIAQGRRPSYDHRTLALPRGAVIVRCRTHRLGDPCKPPTPGAEPLGLPGADSHGGFDRRPGLGHPLDCSYGRPLRALHSRARAFGRAGVACPHGAE